MTWPGLAKENTIFLGLAWETRVAGWSLKEHDTIKHVNDIRRDISGPVISVILWA